MSVSKGKGEVSHSINGSWRGRYFYGFSNEDGGFEAVFVEQDAKLDGSILDDGMLGEAVVSGRFVYPSVSFTKVYRTPGLDPVKYDGTMSEDGKTIAGNWYIRSKAGGGLGITTGTWTAKRYDDSEELSLETLEDRKKELEEEREKVAPQTQPLIT